MDAERERELFEGYQAMQHNPCWQWLKSEVLRRRDYAALRLRQAEDWPDFCALRGELQALEAMPALIAEVRAPFESKNTEVKEDDNEL